MAIAKGKIQQASVDHDLFIRLYIETGDARLAATQAGASHPDYGYRLLRLKAVEIQAATIERANSMGALALSVLSDLAVNSDQDSVRATAAKSLAALSGLEVTRTQDVTPPDNRTDDQLIEALLEDRGLKTKLADRLKGADVLSMRSRDEGDKG